MSNPQAFGTINGEKKFSGTYLHWGISDAQEFVDQAEESFDDLASVVRHIEESIQVGGASSADDFMSGDFYDDSEAVLITGDRDSETYVNGYWVIDDGKEIFEMIADHDEEEAEEIIQENGIGVLSDGGKFSLTFLRPSVGPNQATFVTQK